MKTWIWVWVGANLLDLIVTILAVESGQNVQWLEFAKKTELNPLVRLFPYPEGFLAYKVVITIAMMPIFYLISTKYKRMPMVFNGLFIFTWLGGILSQLMAVLK